MTSPFASIHDLAVELLETIFSYACVDGGSTGRSLSLVSRHFREVVRPIRYHSVALSSFRQTESFLECLEEESARIHIQVRHLFLSTWTDGERVVGVRNGRAPRWDGLQVPALTDGPEWCVWMVLQEAYDKKLAQLLPRLLTRFASGLRSLSIVHSWEFGGIQLPPNFPVLEEFSFFGPPPSFPGWSSDPGSPRPSPCFPALRQLHVVSWNISLIYWMHHSPVLTHLRLSDLTCSAHTLPAELQRFLGCPLAAKYASETSSFKRRGRSRLQHVRLQPRAVPRSYCGVEDVEHHVFVWQLKKLHAFPDICVEVMQDRRYRDGYWDGRIRREWVYGVAFGARWWIGGEEVEEGEEEEDSDIEMQDDDAGSVQSLIPHWM